MTEQSFDFGSFIKGSIDSIVKPKEYFSSLKTDGSIAGPVIKVLIYGAISGVFALLWSLLNLSASIGAFGGAIGIMAFIWSVIAAVIGLFIGAVIMLILSAITGGNTDYVANVHVTAALMVLMPVASILGVFGGINLTLWGIIRLLVNLYGLYMLYFALTGSLKGKEQGAKVLVIVLLSLLVLFRIIGMFTKKAANRFLDDMGVNEEFMEEYQKDVKKGLKDLTKELEEAMEDLEDDEK